MVPETLGALLLFVLLVVPGMLFELLRQRRRLPFEQTSLEEAARIVLWSVVFDAVGIGVVAGVSRLHPSSVVSPAEISRLGASAYWRAHYMAVVLTAAMVCLVASGVAGLTHRSLNHPKREGWAYKLQAKFENFLRHGDGKRIEHAPVWQEVFRNKRPTGMETAVTVIKKDGSMWMGLLGGYTPSDRDDRDLVLKQPVQVFRPKATTAQKLPEDWLLVVIPGREISEVLVRYAEASW